MTQINLKMTLKKKDALANEDQLKNKDDFKIEPTSTTRQTKYEDDQSVQLLNSGIKKNVHLQRTFAKLSLAKLAPA